LSFSAGTLQELISFIISSDKFFRSFKNSRTRPSYRITLVSPNTYFYFKIGAPRALIAHNSFPKDKLFLSVPEALKQYEEACTFVQGKATALTPTARRVTVTVTGGANKVSKYDSLFIGTGTTSSSALWTLHDNHEVSESALNEMHKLLPKAKSILIGGAGRVGVETAGEIASAYPDVKITLVGEVLKKLNPATISKTKEALQIAKVEVLADLRVTDITRADPTTTVTLSDGSSRTVDFFIDARGALKVNNEFLPETWLEETGRVRTDEYFRVKGDGHLGQPETEGIYALGDIVAGSDNTALQLLKFLWPVPASPSTSQENWGMLLAVLEVTIRLAGFQDLALKAQFRRSSSQ
jgi:NADH dehydrogenase FAD-containing subunit